MGREEDRGQRGSMAAKLRRRRKLIYFCATISELKFFGHRFFIKIFHFVTSVQILSYLFLLRENFFHFLIKFVLFNSTVHTIGHQNAAMCILVAGVVYGARNKFLPPTFNIF